MSNDPPQFNIKVNNPSNSPPSPTFGGSVSKKQVQEGMERVGKHGKSHHEYMKVQNMHKPVK